ncbi:lipopolysaccharide biosynthesis protein [Duganella callida]|uniref:Lipopolysaccharide biosynthesis protein n=1 Tax=Duganella callida TaxID=2561932 RepID=A0A4Y9SBB6_9BURK|nr:lipopolysaccharide biosynthesis protein [Duganella callida]TFW19388.1 lipopolysaccharide biosynthesis protein [Duganella callida]
MNQINQSMARGVVWMMGARLLDRSIGIVSTLVLTRLLVPGDFGLVAMATAVGGLLDLLGSFSFDAALIQKANAERRHFDTVWTFNLLFGLVSALGLVLLAAPAAVFYHEPRLTDVMLVMGLIYGIGAFTNVGVVTFRKELQFRQEFIFIAVRRATTFFLTLGAAYLLRSYWALLLGMTVGRLVNVIMSYTMNSYRPRLSLAAARELFHFSKWMLIANCLQFLRHDGCTFMIGKVFGANALGIYSVSYEISNLPTSELVAPINRVSFPGYAKMGQTEVIAQSYLGLLGLIALLIVPVGVGIAAVADPLVRTLLGDKWLEAIPLIAILAVSGALTATQTNNTAVWVALGRPQKVSLVQGCYVAVLFPALYFFISRYGIVGAGYAYLFTQLVDVLIEMRVTRTMLAFSWASALRVVWRPLLGVTTMYLLVRELDAVLVSQPLILRLLTDSLTGAVVYCLVILALWRASGCPPGAEQLSLGRVKSVYAARRPARRVVSPH